MPNGPHNNAANNGITDDLFLDIMLLSGVEHIPVFPPLITPEPVTFQKTAELVRHYKNGHATVMAFTEDPRVKHAPLIGGGYLDQFMRTRAMYKFSLILSGDGSVQPLLLAMPAPAPGSGQ